MTAETALLYHGDALAILPHLASQSVDVVLTDPPYPGIDRDYGHWTEKRWMGLMQGIVRQCQRLLTPSGSAVFILQPNSERIGKMRPWIWDFLSWMCKEWNVIQDLYWWNYLALPSAGCQRQHGLLRPSIKYLIWCGPENCYRDQDSILWTPSDETAAIAREERTFRTNTSGRRVNDAGMAQVALERGGSTPFNLIPLGNASGKNGGGFGGLEVGHPASTPFALCDWLVRYLTPEKGTVLDPFCGSGTMGQAAIKRGHQFIGIDKEEKYVDMAERRLRRFVGGDERNCSPPPTEKVELESCSHEWTAYESIREESFRVAYGSKRTCKKCGSIEWENWCETRASGGTPRIYPPDKK